MKTLAIAVGAALAFGALARSTPVPAPSFAKAVWYRVSPNPSAVVVQDLNGDGKPDLAIANAWMDWQELVGGKWEDMGTVSVRLNRGDGTFAPRRDYSTGADAEALATGDLNGDGVPDLVSGNVAGESISVLLGRGDGSFLPKQNYPVPGDEDLGIAVAVGDVNGDHKPDVAVANGLKDFSVFLNNGDGHLKPRVNYPAGKDVSSVALVDVDGDGFRDAVTANRSTISVLRNNGDGTFAGAAKYDAGKTPWSIASGDLNGDGKPDLAVAGSASVSVLLNAGDGTFAAKRTYPSGPAEWPRINVADVNGDGNPDVVTTTYGGISVLLNAGNGTFEPSLGYRGASAYGDVAVGDLNGDGRPDLVGTAGTDDDENTGVSELAVLINTPGLCNVQRLSRLTLPAAKTQLERAGCAVGKVTWKYAQYVKKGHELSQSPGFGTVLPGRGKVNLVMSKGRR